MRHTPLVVLAMFALGGCYRYSPVEAHIYDSVTKQAVAGLRVRAEYNRLMLEPFPPKMGVTTTDGRGIAQMDVCTNYRGGAAMLVLLGKDESQDYLLDQPLPAVVIDLPPPSVRTAGAMPYRVEVAVVTVQEHRQRQWDEVTHNRPMQWTEPVGKLLVVREPAWRRLGH